MDPLEQFIRENKDELQHRLGDREALWDKINMEIEPRKKTIVKKLNWQRWAAAASIIMAIGVGLFWIQGGNIEEGSIASQKPLEILEIDAHYQKLINARVRQVKNSTSLSETEKSEIISYLEKLEIESRELEKELQSNINNVQIIQAIINNYRERLEIMEKLLDRSNNQNKIRNERNISI